MAVFSAPSARAAGASGRRIHAYAIFGSVEIDLSEAIFEHQQVVIKAIAVFGNVEIRVPENVSLRGTGGGVLGNFEVDTLDSGDRDAPVVYVDGWPFWEISRQSPSGASCRGHPRPRPATGQRKLRKHLGH